MKKIVFFLLGLKLRLFMAFCYFVPTILAKFLNDKNTPCVKTTEPFRVTSVIYLLRDSKERHTLAKYPRQI